MPCNVMNDKLWPYDTFQSGKRIKRHIHKKKPPQSCRVRFLFLHCSCWSFFCLFVLFASVVFLFVDWPGCLLTVLGLDFFFTLSIWEWVHRKHLETGGPFQKKSLVDRLLWSKSVEFMNCFFPLFFVWYLTEKLSRQPKSNNNNNNQFAGRKSCSFAGRKESFSSRLWQSFVTVYQAKITERKMAPLKALHGNILTKLWQ